MRSFIFYVFKFYCNFTFIFFSLSFIQFIYLFNTKSVILLKEENAMYKNGTDFFHDFGEAYQRDNVCRVCYLLIITNDNIIIVHQIRITGICKYREA